ncbi:MAG: Unknown protein [uncultured Sulfurovum sp.]|uniref:Peptidase A2 domain-containing protein n=1 Tax=uncultured Sulfurovum sp. TaxID=269237 RepID=A0A6S6UA95_9BACT|nr:MAG: Unknown protein [uncultured Sulfurovum sp.]
MFNLLIALITGVLIGWNFHAFYHQLSPPNILKNEINISKISNIETTSQPPKVISPTEENISIKTAQQNLNQDKKHEKINDKNTSVVNPFFHFLAQNQFSDAMAIYLDAPNQKLPLYRSHLLDYFKQKSSTQPNEAINHMLEFIQLEPKHKTVSLELIKTYQSIKAYKEAIKLITQRIESVSASESEKLYPILIQNSQLYINQLKDMQEFQKLINFLQAQIELGIKTPFYIYALANVYLEMQNYTTATTLLQEIEYDYDYGEKAKKLLKFIEQKINENKEYTHQLPLDKIGEHFTIDVEIDNTFVTLLLDTGATLTMVNEEKISSLTIIKENIILNTAGGEINAQLQEANTFSIGDIHLQQFKIVSSNFPQKHADGLLGMNFFKRFKFKIDQENALLYLSSKEKVAL